MRTLLVLVLCSLPVAAADFVPDPLSVRRHGPAYRYPQAGWTVLHVEGKPYDRGVQHGTLMATEIAAYARCFAAQQSPKEPAAGWAHIRRLTSALFLRKFDKEYLEEMQGIADGAAKNGAVLDGKPIDLTDIVALNCWAEIESLDSGLEALPTGLEGAKLPTPKPKDPPAQKPEHCSAFAATGPATADGKIVFGHITMFGLYPSRFYNVWLDVKPEKGHRVLMQSYPGGIQSGMDYYLTDAGLLVSETTINQTKFHADGIPVTNRIRKAVQYGESINDVVKILSDGNNGLYTNEWLIADTKTNEIAMFELGTKATRLWRSSKDEWFGGTKGFYWGCNNTKDLAVRLEAVPDVKGRPESTAWVPSARDQKWLQFYKQHAGKITADIGRKAFATPPICAASSLDAKVTTTALAKELKTLAVFGPPIGGTWEPTDSETADYPEIVPLVPNDWTVLHPGAPPRTERAKVADLPTKALSFLSPADRKPLGLPTTKPVWKGTLLAKTDDDLWLTESFAAYERIVALERALAEETEDGELTAEDRDRIAVEMNVQRTRIGAAADRDGPGRARFVHSETGRGVLRLAALRTIMGDERFLALMNDFGEKHAGTRVTSGDFVAAVKQHAKTGETVDFLRADTTDAGGPAPTLRSWADDQEKTVIVYGTTADVRANRETAEHLQKAIARRGSNVVVPLMSDVQALDSKEKMAGRHVILVGGPTTNKRTDQWQDRFPVQFRPGSFQVRDQWYAHPGSAVIAAGAHPGDKDFSVVAIAGLTAEATRFAVPFFLARDLRPGTVLLLPNQARGRSLVVK